MTSHHNSHEGRRIQIVHKLLTEDVVQKHQSLLVTHDCQSQWMSPIKVFIIVIIVIIYFIVVNIIINIINFIINIINFVINIINFIIIIINNFIINIINFIINIIMIYELLLIYIFKLCNYCPVQIIKFCSLAVNSNSVDYLQSIKKPITHSISLSINQVAPFNQKASTMHQQLR